MKTKKKDMTQISIFVPSNLVEAIDKMAAAQNRNRSNFIANEMMKLAQSFRSECAKEEK